ncbi:ubiquitin-conjugating enzyme/RWD-like protein [Tanacetum coccineum]
MHKKKIKKAAVKASSRSALLFPSSEHEKVEVKKYLEEISGVSCSSIEDVLVEHDNTENSAMIVPCNEEDTLKRYENFKKFDTVVDHSDHLFSAHTSAETVKKASMPKKWVDRISEEWKVLQEHLPDTIFVRVYEDRKDLLRAVIVGQEGTPYQDALFFFDVCFPSDYPYSSPLGPNQSTRGKVSWFLHKTTSLLKKTWVPGTSNILQFLVSIQGLVLNAKPLFNGHTFMTDAAGQWWSLLYNENTIIKSLKTMVYTMKRPPKNFEFFVDGHFCKRARDILLACRSYTDGLQVGCLASGKNKTCSIKFQKDVTACVKPLVTEFNKRGAKVDFQMKESCKKKTCSIKFQKDVTACIKPLVTEFNKRGAKVAIQVKENSKDVGEKDIIVAPNKKRKVVGEEHMNGAAKKKRKEVDENMFVAMLRNNAINYTHSYVSPSSFTVEKVLVKKGAKVERGQPLCSLGPWETEHIPSRIQKILERNHSSHVGIFSMEDVFVYENYNWQMEGVAFEDVLRSYQNFGKFDTVVDHSDNFFSAESSAMNQPPKDWVDKIREEWRILAENLPETIFVRVYEDRMDLLRGVIIGPQGTPCHNGLFFFDVCFPSNYPDSPPLVHYRWRWPGEDVGWQFNYAPTSALHSGSDLNTNPLYNDITYSVMKGSVYGEQSSALYNQNTLIKTLKTMVYTMKNPPKNFEVFVVGHFHNRVGDILMACNKESGSVTNKEDLDSCINQVEAAIIKMGPTKK